ncbi:SHOCT domain-containing protein [uncultured Microbacterium sp.]|uniref:SHOCT domain-containing protein n=1 Tax=uncultured Microbacterium sp. TaxID=191216 RepID=UPI0035CAA7A7
MAVRTTVVAGTAAVVAGSVARAQAPAPAEAAPLESAPAPVEYAAPPVDAAPAAAPESSTIDQLTQLAALKTAGVLTDAEFEAQKAKLLA